MRFSVLFLVFALLALVIVPTSAYYDSDSIARMNQGMKKVEIWCKAKRTKVLRALELVNPSAKPELFYGTDLPANGLLSYLSPNPRTMDARLNDCVVMVGAEKIFRLAENPAVKEAAIAQFFSMFYRYDELFPIKSTKARLNEADEESTEEDSEDSTEAEVDSAASGFSTSERRNRRSRAVKVAVNVQL